MFERFTSDARRIVVRAGEEARRLKHNYEGTEHLLLGFLADRSRENTGGAALRDHGVTLPSARKAVKGLIGLGQTRPGAPLPPTPRYREVTELASQEARQMGHDFIDSGHLLLGLIRQRSASRYAGSSVADKTLSAMRVDSNRLRNSVLQHMSQLAPTRR